MSALVKRLASQIELAEQRQAEYDQLKAKLEAHKQEHEQISAQQAELKKSTSTLETLAHQLEKREADIRGEMRKNAEEDKRRRHQLSDRVGNRANEITARMDKEGTERVEALRENEILKNKVEIYENNTGSTEDKFKELMEQRSNDAENLQTKLAEEVKRETDLKTATEETQKLVEEKTPAVRELKVKADKYMEEFTVMQNKIKAGNDQFAKRQGDLSRLAKKVTTLDAETKEAAQRFSKTESQLEQEVAGVQAILNKVESNRQRMEQLDKLLNLLKNKDVNVAASPKQVTSPASHVDPVSQSSQE